jgi:benzoyl-CoA reductase/2-hydroxyglutaryl-CoA dehydratase subunit BcrC/BadD/HgdB
VLPLIGTFWLMDRAEYGKLAAEAAKDLEQREPMAGTRLLIKGAPLDHLRLHAALESHGAVVVAEDDWWGARSAGADIEADNDALKAVFEHYYLDAPSPRVFPADAADRWFESRVTEGVDGVVFYLPPEDYVAGWDYPRQKSFLDRLGIPSMAVREDSDAAELSSEAHEGIERFVHEAVRNKQG